MKFTFHPEACNELSQAAEFYEGHLQKLGAEIRSTISRIIEFPNAFPLQSKSTRKCLTNKFPFAIIYQIKNNEIFIVAVTHLSRKPGYWEERNT